MLQPRTRAIVIIVRFIGATSPYLKFAGRFRDEIQIRRNGLFTASVSGEVQSLDEVADEHTSMFPRQTQNGLGRGTPCPPTSFSSSVLRRNPTQPEKYQAFPRLWEGLIHRNERITNESIASFLANTNETLTSGVRYLWVHHSRRQRPRA